MSLFSQLNKFNKLYFQYQSAKRMFAFLKKCIPPFMKERIANRAADKRILLVSMGWYDVKTEAIYMKALEALGYQAYVVTRWDPFVAKFFKLFGIKKVNFYHNYFRNISFRKIQIEAKNILRKIPSEDILGVKNFGIQVGKYAASSFMRITRNSSLDLEDKRKRSIFTKQLIRSLTAAYASQMALEDTKPSLLFVMDRGYTPVGQLFDYCLNNKIPVIQRCGSHKSGSEILKRFSSPEMNATHHYSLSKQSWQFIKNMPWSKDLWDELRYELESTYSSGDWFSEVGTQFNKRIYSKDELISKLKMDPNKKTAAIFVHMFWDATFFWGKDLFKDYYDWFINLLKVVKDCKNLNWLIKIHPANIIKAKRDNFRGRHRELVAIYETLGKIPEHIKIIPPESDISTFGLFEFIDYCLTVRGTIGAEVTPFGVRTLTAGTGRYDRLGFTRDFSSKEEYLRAIKNLENIPSMSEEEIELARRYAYGIFILKPIHLDILEHGYLQDERATMKFRPLFKTKEEFENSGFVRKFREFVTSGKEDLMDLERMKVSLGT